MLMRRRHAQRNQMVAGNAFAPGAGPDRMTGPILTDRHLLASGALLFLVTGRAHAYGDPGSGALLWQMALAAMFGGMFYIRRILNWFRRGTAQKKPEEKVSGDE